MKPYLLKCFRIIKFCILNVKQQQWHFTLFLLDNLFVDATTYVFFVFCVFFSFICCVPVLLLVFWSLLCVPWPVLIRPQSASSVFFSQPARSTSPVLQSPLVSAAAYPPFILVYIFYVLPLSSVMNYVIFPARLDLPFLT